MARLLACIALTWSLSASAQTFPLRGTVTGPAGAIAGADVRVRNQDSGETLTVLTNDAGTFALEVPGGFFQLSIFPPVGSGLAILHNPIVEIREAVEGRFRLSRLVTVAGRCSFPAGKRDARATLYSMRTPGRQYQPLLVGDAFELPVPADPYAIHCSCYVGSDFWFGRLNVDATAGDARGAVVELRANAPVLPATPPRAALISIGTAAADGVADVVGAPGAVDPLSSVVVANLDTNQIAITVAGPDGGFTTPMFAPPGSFIQVKHDPTGRYLPNINFGGTVNNIALPLGTILHVPLSSGPNAFDVCGGPSLGDVRSNFTTAERFGERDLSRFWIRGTYQKTTWSPGEPITLRGTITLFSRNIDAALNLTNVRMSGDIQLDRLFDANGAALQPTQQFMSSVMTPTGLPIERQGNNGMGGQIRIESLRYVEPHRLEGEWTFQGRVKSNAPPGLYVPRLTPTFTGLFFNIRHFDTFPVMEGGPRFGFSLPPIRIGAPTPLRLYWTLALDDLVNGLRGGVAVEDRGKFQVASHVAISSDVQILPPRDARSGAPIRYRLEPFVPMMAMSTARLTDSPHFPFRFPSGSLTVRVRKPDGTIDDLGSAPFVQSMSRMPHSRTGHDHTGASSSVSDYYQLTTLDPRFEYAFAQYGRHVVTMTGWIEDVWGNRYDGGGTYEVFAARSLDLETAILPGTPFTIGSTAAPVVVVQPPVPAEIELTVRHLPDSDSARAVRYGVSGRANRFGYARLPTDGIRFDTPGEYRLDVVAHYTDPEGTLWMGTATWGNVVATPGSPLRTHGRRGFDGVNAIQPQWFLVREARAGGDHVMFPFHRGDVMWMQKDDPAADIPKITVQDTQGAFADRVRNRRGPIEPPSMNDRITAGEIPLFSWSGAGEDPSSAPELVDQWGYFYAYAERPGVRVREFISEDQSNNGYWRFADIYHFQLGNGPNGDLPNDFKFQFGGAVFRDRTDGFRYYGAYSSFFVLLPFQDPIGGRVMPPFQGNGGGPNGGPLFRLKDREIDLFLHPTGLRAGTILQMFELASLSGYIGPTLPAKVKIVITAPSGATQTITGQANDVGYFYMPEADFRVDESGAWRAKIEVTFDGQLGFGAPVEPPYPTGDVLGSRQGEFYFYVVDAATPQLEVAPMPPFVRPADGPITFTMVPPTGLSNVEMHYTTTMPGFILEEGRSSELTYVYDASRLARDFPNLDLHDSDGFAGADTITISLLVSGTDSAGARKHLARQIVLQGEELQMPEQPPPPPRRRGVRR